ncbi:MAG: hypothetical protein LBI39_02120 [Puniceicoccales bacterium]|jgi:hypothetical protein|nr:hypothetical protein [Puniceicoccales bacterium]
MLIRTILHICVVYCERHKYLKDQILSVAIDAAILQGLPCETCALIHNLGFFSSSIIILATATPAERALESRRQPFGARQPIEDGVYQLLRPEVRQQIEDEVRQLLLGE